MTPLKIAITGGSGFIGKYLINLLSAQGNEILVLDKSKNNFDSEKISSAECNILDLENVTELTQGFDCIIHLAALRSVRESMSRPADYNQVNIQGTVNVLESARKNDVKKVIFASSSAVYGNNFSFPQKESDYAKPSNPYGLTKLTGEQYCSIYAENYGLETVSFRLFNVYGPDQQADAGVISAFVNSALTGKKAPLYGSGNQKRDFVFVEDVAEAFGKAIENSSSVKGKSINIGFGKNYSVIEIKELVEKLSGKSVLTDKKESFVGDVKETLADISVAKKFLNWQPKTGLEDGIKRIISY